jgi:N-acetylglucosamine-6-phosphate deacetylase
MSGFVDLQVNGFLGVNFSDAALTQASVNTVCTALYERGTIAFCPTVITTSMEAYRESFCRSWREI